MKSTKFNLVIAGLVLLFGFNTANAQVKVAVYPNSFQSHNIVDVLNTQADIQATVVSTYDAATLAQYDVLMNIRGRNLAQPDVIQFIEQGGTWIGEFSSNRYPILSWGLISSTSSPGYLRCCTGNIEIINNDHYLVQNVDWANLPLGTASTGDRFDFSGINDPAANIIVKGGAGTEVPNNPVLVEKAVGLGRIILLNWDYSDDPDENLIIQDLVQEVVRYGGTSSSNVDTEAPVINLQPVTVHLDANGEASISIDDIKVSITDNEGIASEELSKSTFNCENIGENEVTVTATDINGNISSATTIVTVVNDIPVLNTVALPTEPIKINNAITGTASFTDVNAHSANWYWGDGDVSKGTISGSEITGGHTYATPGIYTVTVELIDICGEKTTLEHQYVIIIDPNAGHVTGGGWINSPAGAYKADASVEGKAQFGFVSKYNNSGEVPVGNVQFSLQNAKMKFHSTSYDWLVLHGNKATFMGEGRLNNKGNHGFFISVLTGENKDDADNFRIKIWEKATGVVIYDNQTGDGLDADAIMPIERGSIQIHKGEEESSNARTTGEITKPFEVDMFPNPAASRLNVQVLNREEDHVRYTVYDFKGNIVRDLSEIGIASIDIEELEAGVYFLVVESTQGVKRERFIKSNP